MGDHHPHHADHHGHRAGQHQSHSHGIVDPVLASTDRGLWALKWSFLGLMATSAVQLVVVILSGSVGLLADTIHNVADASTAIPLGIAFWLSRRRAPRRLSYGYGRVEDLAGLAIIATIAASAAVAGYESVRRLQHPQDVDVLWAVMVASVVGFLGNEAVAIFRIRVGGQIGSAALVADGYHARVDGWTSLAVFVGALGIWAGYPLADPIVGLVISATIVVLVVRSARAILWRVLDGVDSAVLDEIAHAARQAHLVEDVTDVRARWIGHRLHADLSVTVAGSLSVTEGHEVAREVRHHLLHHVPHLVGVHVHVDPSGAAGEVHHRIGQHAHDGLPMHSHG